MKSKEKKYEADFTNAVKALGWEGFKVNKKSYPDHQYTRNGRDTFFVEFKDDGAQPTLLQARQIELLRGAGYSVYVVNSAKTLKSVLEKIMQLDIKC